MLCVAGFSILVKGSFICLFSLHLFPCPDAPYVPKNQTKPSANGPKYFSSNKMMGVAKKHRCGSCHQRNHFQGKVSTRWAEKNTVIWLILLFEGHDDHNLQNGLHLLFSMTWNSSGKCLLSIEIEACFPKDFYTTRRLFQLQELPPCCFKVLLPWLHSWQLSYIWIHTFMLKHLLKWTSKIKRCLHFNLWSQS